MATVLTDNQHYGDIADAIRAKGVSGTFLPSEMAAAIAAIPAGGGLPFKTGSVTVSASQQINITHNLNTLKVIVFYWATAGTITAATAVRGCFGLFMPHIDNVLGDYYQYLSDGSTKVKALVKPFIIGAQMSANQTGTSMGTMYTNAAVTYPETQTVNKISVKNTGSRWNGTFNWIAIDISGGVS